MLAIHLLCLSNQAAAAAVAASAAEPTITTAAAASEPTIIAVACACGSLSHENRVYVSRHTINFLTYGLENLFRSISPHTNLMHLIWKIN